MAILKVHLPFFTTEKGARALCSRDLTHGHHEWSPIPFDVTCKDCLSRMCVASEIEELMIDHKIDGWVVVGRKEEP